MFLVHAGFPNSLRKPQLNEMEAKATKRLAALRAVSGSTWGTSVDEMRTLYRGTILPLFMYCASVWYIPAGGHGYKDDQNRALRTLRTIQRRAAQVIGGAFGTTAGEALDVELHLTPVDLAQEHVLADTMMRLVSNRAYEGIRKIREISKINSHTVNTNDPAFTQLSPLRKVEKLFEAKYYQQLSKIERRCAFVSPPWWIPMAITIHDNAETAQVSHDAINDDPQNITICTDGSGINKFIAVSAVWAIPMGLTWTPLIAHTRKAFLGTDRNFTVYTGELYKIVMALELIRDRDDPESKRPIYIFTDNQAAIRTSRRPRNQAGQYMRKRIVELNESLKGDITIQWIPAHTGVPGNEAADTATKEATGWREEGYGDMAENPPDLQTITSAIKPNTRLDRTIKWERTGRTSRHGGVSRRLTSVPHKNNLLEYQILTKAESAILLQARTGKTGLRSYLYRIGAAESPRCECGGIENVKHVLPQCPKWTGQRVKYLGQERESHLSRWSITTTRYLQLWDASIAIPSCISMLHLSDVFLVFCRGESLLIDIFLDQKSRCVSWTILGLLRGVPLVFWRFPLGSRR